MMDCMVKFWCSIQKFVHFGGWSIWTPTCGYVVEKLWNYCKWTFYKLVEKLPWSVRRIGQSASTLA